jgi:N-acetylated-alpha-linked acidic dipeptidase
MAVPDTSLAREHLRTLTAAPHWASSPEDYATALYVANQFKAAGLETSIVPYRVLLNRPMSTIIEAFDGDGKRIFTGPSREHVEPAADTAVSPDAFQDDPRVLPGFNGSSPSGDVTGEVVYANYGRLADFERLAGMGVSVKGRIVLVRYGGDFRGVKVYLAEQYGAAGVLIYSDPTDQGSPSGPTYPDGPYRPDSAVQRGSVQFLPIYPGDPQTPGVASTPGLPESKRIPVDKLQYNQPTIPVSPLSSADAAPILRAMGGPESPRDWQGALPFPYHVGGAAAGKAGTGVTVHLHLVEDTRLRTIWDVIGRIPGEGEDAEEWVVAGNHRDAWVYGAADPGSGTAAMLEAVHGLGALLRRGWRPRRTILIASWDAEEEGLMGSTEWVEQHEAELSRAVAYFNTDVAVSGPTFTASSVPSLREFVREITREVPSPAGGTVYDRWSREDDTTHRSSSPGAAGVSATKVEPHVGDLGSGSDYTPFLQHAGVPATDIASDGPFGVYHTVYDNYAWFTRFADPHFVYVQQQARIFGLEILHMADADVLPYDYQVYGDEIRGYLNQAHSSAAVRGVQLDFSGALAAAERFSAAGEAMRRRQLAPPANTAALNHALRAAEEGLLIPEGLPARPWYRHSIYAPGLLTGYTAVVIPGVNEGIEGNDAARAQEQLASLTAALGRAAAILEAGLGQSTLTGAHKE